MNLRPDQIAETLARVVSSGWVVKGTTVTFENEADALTDAEIEAAFNSYQYVENRLANYPSLGDFADAYYWSQKGDDTKMIAYVAACDAVKTKYPKPEVA